MTNPTTIDEILEDWLEEAQSTSMLGVTIDDTRTDDDRDRDYIAALDKAKAAIETLLVAAKVATLQEFINWIYDPKIELATIEDYAADRIAELKATTTTNKDK